MAKQEKPFDGKWTILKALSCEQDGHVLEAQYLYEEGLEQLRAALSEEKRPLKQNVIKRNLQQYEASMQRLHKKLQAKLMLSKLIERNTIMEGSRGHSYKSVFGRFLNKAVIEVQVYEVSLESRADFKDLISFLELCAKNCPKLKYVRVITIADTRMPRSQLYMLDQLRSNLAIGNIQFNYQMEESLVECKVVLSTGIVFRLNRGLHFFQVNEPRYALGMCDYDFRRCKRTDIEIWQLPSFSESTE